MSKWREAAAAGHALVVKHVGETSVGQFSGFLKILSSLGFSICYKTHTGSLIFFKIIFQETQTRLQRIEKNVFIYISKWRVSHISNPLIFKNCSVSQINIKKVKLKKIVNF